MAAVAKSLVAGPVQRFDVGFTLDSAAGAAAVVVAALLGHLQNEAEILQLVLGFSLAVGF